MIRAYTLVVLAVIATVGLAEASNAGRICNITSYGASFGASGSVNSAALQSAFTACNNGGTVVIAAGVFVIDPMKIEYVNNTVVRFDYGFLHAPPASASQAGNYVLKFEHASHVTLVADALGGIDGNGTSWWSSDMAMQAPPLLEFEEATDVKVQGLTFENPGSSAVSITGSSSVYLDRLVVSISQQSPSPYVSGVDIKDTSTDVSVDSCSIAATFACVSVYGGVPPQCTSSVTVTDSTCYGAGFKVGPMQAYGGYCINGVKIGGSEVTNADIGVLIATVPTQGSLPRNTFVSDVSVTRVSLGSVHTGLMVSEAASVPPHIEVATKSTRLGAPLTAVPITGVSFTNVDGTGATLAAGNFTGAASAQLHVSLSSVSMSGAGFTCSNAVVSGTGVSPALPASCA